jgi:hypothetical protein
MERESNGAVRPAFAPIEPPSFALRAARSPEFSFHHDAEDDRSMKILHAIGLEARAKMP